MHIKEEEANKRKWRKTIQWSSEDRESIRKSGQSVEEAESSQFLVYPRYKYELEEQIK